MPKRMPATYGMNDKLTINKLFIPCWQFTLLAID